MDIYSTITQRIIEQLEQGYIPWKKSWVNCLEGSFNRAKQRPYSLLNQLLLKHEGEYATLRQWDQAGGKVRKGEKAEIVVFWKMKEKEEQGEHGEIVMKKIPVLKYYNVFHISQVENVLPLPKVKDFGTKPIERAEKTLYTYLYRERILLSVGENNRAFYNPADDSITLPSITQFKQPEAYYGVAFHECAHSTLKASRCNREKENRFAYAGTNEYSKEELIAEIASAAILHSMGMETPETFQNSAAYIQSWLRVLKNDKKFIVYASGKAEKAARYILGTE